MYNIIICEGTDGTGKTTLAQSIADNYGYHYHWFGKPDKGEAFVTYLKEYFNLMDYTNVVMDRAHFSEDVYGPLFRDGSEFTDMQREKLEAMLGSSVVVVLCTLPDKVIKGNLAKTPEDLHHDKEPDIIAAKYRDVLYATAFPVLAYDFRTHTVEQLMGQVAVKQSMDSYVASR